MPKIPSNYTRIVDFQDFNYERVAFDIDCMLMDDRKALKERLKRDYVNHLWEFDGAGYFAIWNCDLQGFKTTDDIYFDSDKHDYKLIRPHLIDGEWYYTLIGELQVCEDKWMM